MTTYQNQSKEDDKIFRYKDLILEIQSMWNVRVTLISIITEATGTFPESLRKYSAT